MTGDDDRTAEDLREEQAAKARAARRQAEDATTEHAAIEGDRRAEKAAYLAKRLAEQERSEEEQDR